MFLDPFMRPKPSDKLSVNIDLVYSTPMVGQGARLYPRYDWQNIIGTPKIRNNFGAVIFIFSNITIAIRDF